MWDVNGILYKRITDAEARKRPDAIRYLVGEDEDSRLAWFVPTDYERRAAKI